MTDPSHDWLSLERFEFSRVGEWAVLRLLTRLETDIASSTHVGLIASGQAELVIDRGADIPVFSPARAYRLEQRLLAKLPRRGAGSGSELLWRAVFAIPRQVVESRGAMFKLSAGGRSALALPAPRLRVITPRALALAEAEEAATRFTLASSRQRFAAVATTAVVLTGTSSPAIAFAGGISGAHEMAKASGSAVPAQGEATTLTVGQLAARELKRAKALAAASAGAKPAAASPTTKPAASPSPATSTTSASPSPSPATSTTSASPSPSPATSSTTATTPTETAKAPSTAPKATASPPSATHRRHSGGSKMEPTVPKTTVAPTTPAPSCQTPTHRGAVSVSPEARLRSVHPGVGIARAPNESCTPLSPPTTGTHPTKRTRPTKATHPGAGLPPTKRVHSGTGTHPPKSTHTGHGHHHGRHASTATTGGAAVQKPTPGSVGTGSSTTSHPPSVGTLSSSAPGFLAPRAWTGTVTADPSLTGAVRNLSGLLANGNRPPSFLIPIYMQAGKRYDVPWEVLAAINAIESDYGRDLSTSTAGAVGWMQFEPSTWREWGVAADGHSVANPYDPRDAIFSAARYLKAAGAQQSISKAVFAYNHANWYVDEVLSRAQAIGHHAQYERVKTNKRGIFSVFFATGLKRHPRIRYSGGRLSHYDRLIAAANMVSAANFQYVYGGGHEQPARFGPFDCSGAVSYVTQQAGYKVPTTVSGDIPIWKFPAGPGRVTIFYNPVHTYMRIGNRYFGTSGFARPGGGAGWFDVNKLPAGYLAQFREVHVPHLGRDSFAAPRLPKHPDF